MHDIADPNHNPAAGPLILAEAMGAGGIGAVIKAQEKRGQQALVHSELLPTELQDDQAAFEALGFVFGDVEADDPLFRRVSLPEGWSREASDHAMWSYIVDGLGRRRVGVFYKAAYYDRKADASVLGLSEYLERCAYEGLAPVLDEKWATAAEVLRIAEERVRERGEKAVWWEGHGRDEYAHRSREMRDAYARIAEAVRR
jgi:hypothetical protein